MLWSFSLSAKRLRLWFRGYVWDDRLQMYHVRHRVYDPMPGPAGLRWLQRDPAFFVDGLNLYAYCGGDPVNGVDPLGLWPITWTMVHEVRGWNGQTWGTWHHHYDRNFFGLERHRESQFVPDGGGSETGRTEADDVVDGFNRDRQRQADQISVGASYAEAGLKTVQTAGALMIAIAVPGPDDLIVAAIAAKYGARLFSRLGDEIYAEISDGRKILLEGDEAARAGRAIDAQKLQALRRAELDTLMRASERLGLKLKPSPHQGADFIDECGKTYDAIGGGPNPAEYLDLGRFADSFRGHFLKSVDRVLLDVTGMTEAQKQAVRALINELSATDRARLIEMGF